MKRTILALIATITLAIPASAVAQTTHSSVSCSGALTWQAAAASVGQTVTVKTLVLGAKHVQWKSGKGHMTFLDTGRAYPAHGLTLVVWNRDVESYKGSTVCAHGKVTLYKGVPEMSVDTTSDIRKA